jgi:hypothetical protein
MLKLWVTTHIKKYFKNYDFDKKDKILILVMKKVFK